MLVRSSRTASITLAFDRSVRKIDAFGRLHIEVSNISKAAVNPYRGEEIPNAEQLGLDPDKVYMLLRDPEELEKAAPTFNGLPLLCIHEPTSAEDHPKEITVGATGTDAEFAKPYLRNSLVIWPAEDIAGVETDQQRELSSSYSYDADMTPGEYEGTAYDGVMRNIVGNHVALVEAGRAGPDVLVFDSFDQLFSPNAKKEPPMAHKLASRKALLLSGALGVYIRPKLAADAKIDLSPVASGITRKNFAAKKASVIAAVTKLTKGKLAADADLGDLDKVLDAVADLVDGDEDDDEIMEAAMDGECPPKRDDESDAEFEARKAKFAKDKAAKDEEDEKAKAEAEKKAEDEESMKDKVSKSAMDAALASAIAKTTAEVRAAARKDARDLRDAEEAVKPYVGAVVAMDSAGDVYRFAIEKIAPDVELKGVPDSALPSILKAFPVPGSQLKTRIAMDGNAIARADAELAALSASTSNARS